MFRWIAMAGFLGTAAGLIAYHVALRSRHIVRHSEPPHIHRFSLGERCVHLLAILSLFTLAVTGFWAVLVCGGPLRGWLWLAHFAAAPVFAATIAIIGLIWSADGHFERRDLEWLRHFGGYLWKKDDLPAGRFNAGQKIYFWLIGLLAVGLGLSGAGRMVPLFDAAGQQALLDIHRYCALALALAVIGHLYLGALANPGTLGAMITGRVCSHWARHHHPDWWKDTEGGN